MKTAFLSPVPTRTSSCSTFHKPPLSRKHRNVSGKIPLRVIHTQMVSNPPRETVFTSSAPSTDTSNTDKITFTNPQFKDAVDGEWFGYECAFSGRDGTSLKIEERYVPDAYREWGVELKGFDSLTSSIVTDDGKLLIRRTRALPTVGCEADAVIPEVVEHLYNVIDTNELGAAFEDGSVSNGPSSISFDDFSPRWHMCISSSVQSGRRARFEFGRVDEQIGKIIVFIETRDGPFHGGEILPGCGGTNESFADDPITAIDSLTGKWNIHRVGYQQTVDNKWIETSDSFDIDRDEAAAEKEVNICLPRGFTVGTTRTDENLTVVAGWLEENRSRTVLRRTYDQQGQLVSVVRDIEVKQL